MQLLDSTLAFVLTLAAMATVVTVILEACIRLSRMKKKNFIEVMKLLNNELGNSNLGMNNEDRWEFFIKVVQNPIKESIKNLNPIINGLDLTKKLAYFGYESQLGKGKFKRFILCIWQLFGDKKRSGLYETVSLEYMLRCLADIPPIKKASLTAGDKIKTELNRIARRYEELNSSVSESFKHNAQAWSIAIGILLAIFANIDGLTIFEAYRQDPALASSVIEKQQEFLDNWKESQKSLSESDKEKQTDLKSIEATMQRAQKQIANIANLGVPIGWKQYPNCPFGGTITEWEMSCPKCKDIPLEKREIKNNNGKYNFFTRLRKTLLYDPCCFILWFFVTIGTGVLIGLGAPFWFDVAKRLAQIRKGIQNPNASAEYRMSGSDANGDYKKRKEIVENILTDAANEAKVEKNSGNRRILLNEKGDDHDHIA